ncbi:MAG: hypothetical protein ABIQ66_10530 [Novosphingobium sp.]
MKLRSALLIGSALALPAAPIAAGLPGPSQSGRFNSEPLPSRFLAPTTPLILTRELRRSLADGKEVVSRRSYQISFVPDGSGYRIDGVMTNAEVEAPPALAALAALERQRRDIGLFPLQISGDGLIVVQHGSRDPVAEAQSRAVIGSALQHLALTEADRQAAAQTVSRLAAQANAVGGNWPSDLFRPAPGERSQVREIALPDGTHGTVTETISAAGAESGLLRRMERRVVTEIDGTRRVNREIWTLSEPQ